MSPRRILCLLLLVTLMLPSAARGGTRKILNLCGVSHPSDAGIDWECHRMRGGETPERLVGDLWLDLLRFNRIDRRHLYAGVSIKVPKNPLDIAGFSPLPDFYEDASLEEKFILVDLSEQFLAAYEYGRKVLSFPIASGSRKFRTPTGDFRVSAFSRRHKSSLYKIEKTNIPYPMHYGLRFFVNRQGVAFWIHGRDLPGFPASHGCVGLYDEEMQRKYYRFSREILLQDSRTLYQWVVGPAGEFDEFTLLKGGARVRIVGESPL